MGLEVHRFEKDEDLESVSAGGRCSHCRYSNVAVSDGWRVAVHRYGVFDAGIPH